MSASRESKYASNAAPHLVFDDDRDERVDQPAGSFIIIPAFSRMLKDGDALFGWPCSPESGIKPLKTRAQRWNTSRRASLIDTVVYKENRNSAVSQRQRNTMSLLDATYQSRRIDVFMLSQKNC